MRPLSRVSTAIMAALLFAGCGDPGGGEEGEEVKVSSVSLNKTSLTLETGASETLVANVAPSNAANRNVTWRSSFSAIASVDGGGKVTAVRAGASTITVETVDGGHTATCEVTVSANSSANKVAVTGVAISTRAADVEVGGEFTLTANIIPSNATDKKADWSSSNPAVATIDAAGRVRAVTVGQTTVTITTNDGAKTASCVVTVEAEDSRNLLKAKHIPDPVFLEYCRTQMVEWDENEDGKLYADEAAAVRVIDVANAYGSAISSLAGIEYFTGLTYLDCSQNNLAELDVSRCTQLDALFCNNNSRLSRLVLSYSRLTLLNCSACMLSTLDVSRCTRLVELRCYSNELTSLDVSACTALKLLDVDRNRLTSLDLSRNRALAGLICSNNQFTNLNLSQCAELSDLQADGNRLTSLDLSRNTNMLMLNCNRNLLTELDISNNPRLSSLICDGNRLASIKIDSGNSQLELVRNSSNNLSAAALNDIFENLPYFGTIVLSNNPGTATCDLDIIRDKNWNVQSD